MNYHRLGRTGLQVSQFCLGTMQWGWSADQNAAFAVMDAFVAAGGTFLDTADVYSRWIPGNPGGVSEAIIGRWLNERGHRQEIVLATKCRGRMWPGPNGEGLSRLHVIRACEDSLRRLGTDYIDLYQTHSVDPNTPIDETLRALDDLVQAGKVRYVGCSNISAWRLTKALWMSDKYQLARYDSLQPHYNLVHRQEFERELRELCLEEQVGVVPYSPLAAGFLTGKHARGTSPAGARAEGIKSRYLNDQSYSVLDLVTQTAHEHGAAPGQIALAWLLAQPAVTAPIIGANSPEQLEENLGALAVKLTPDELAALDKVSQGL
jgi:aryl-alcohol dehydrogenase-like predicted oxidoreductase